MERYKKNWGTFITEKQQQELLEKHILVIGCGGTGGYVLEQCARLGVKKITFYDYDNYDCSNLNRQHFCNETVLNQPKTQSIVSQLKSINSTIEYIVHNEMFNAESLNTLLLDLPDFCFCCVDATKNILDTRLAILDLIKMGVPTIDVFIHEIGCSISLADFNHLNAWYQNTDSYLRSEKCQLIVSQLGCMCGLVSNWAILEMIRFFTLEEYPFFNCILEYEFFTNIINIYNIT